MTGIKISLVCASLSTGMAGVTGIITESGGELAKTLEEMSATGLLAFISVICIAYAWTVTKNQTKILDETSKRQSEIQQDTNKILRELVSDLHDRPCFNHRGN